MKRQMVKFPWDLYWENKTHKVKRSRAMKISVLKLDWKLIEYRPFVEKLLLKNQTSSN